MTHLLLWALQVALGAVIAVVCFYLVKARFVVVRVLGWLVAAYFILRYAQGCVISIRLVLDGSWIEVVTAAINVFLALTILVCALKARWIRKGYVADEL